MPVMEFSTELVETIDHAARQSGESPEAFVREAVLAALRTSKTSL